MTILHCETPLLRVAYRSGGPADGPVVLLLHGWPDDPATFDGVAPALHAAGYRSIAPWLRGFGATRFRSPETFRSGEIVALAQDAIDLADALEIERFVVIGHDWGARAAYLMALLFPQRIRACAALSVGWEPGVLATPVLGQARAFWYQWFLATERGAAEIHRDGKGFARFQWEHWGPLGWFTDADFEQVAESFDNPDWAEVTLHSYRIRWGEAEPDPRYAALRARLSGLRVISVPTLTLHGAEDRCILPGSSEARDALFRADYQRLALPGVGHFPTREAPQAVTRLLLDFLRSCEVAG